MTTNRVAFTDSVKPGPSQQQRAVLDEFARTTGKPTTETAAQLAALEFSSPDRQRALSEGWTRATRKLASPFWK